MPAVPAAQQHSPPPPRMQYKPGLCAVTLVTDRLNGVLVGQAAVRTWAVCQRLCGDEVPDGSHDLGGLLGVGVVACALDELQVRVGDGGGQFTLVLGWEDEVVPPRPCRASVERRTRGIRASTGHRTQALNGTSQARARASVQGIAVQPSTHAYLG